VTLPAGVAALAAQLPTLQLWSKFKPSARQLRWVLDPRPAAMFGGFFCMGVSALIPFNAVICLTGIAAAFACSVIMKFKFGALNAYLKS